MVINLLNLRSQLIPKWPWRCGNHYSKTFSLVYCEKKFILTDHDVNSKQLNICKTITIYRRNQTITIKMDVCNANHNHGTHTEYVNTTRIMINLCCDMSMCNEIEAWCCFHIGWTCKPIIITTYR